MQAFSWSLWFKLSGFWFQNIVPENGCFEKFDLSSHFALVCKNCKFKKAIKFNGFSFFLTHFMKLDCINLLQVFSMWLKLLWYFILINNILDLINFYLTWMLEPFNRFPFLNTSSRSYNIHLKITIILFIFYQLRWKKIDYVILYFSFLLMLYLEMFKCDQDGSGTWYLRT